MANTHDIEASPSTVHWGYFDAELDPVMEIASGDTINLNSVSGGPDNLPGPDYYIPPELLEIHKKVPKRMHGHILTGPIRISNAKPGQVLQVDILDIGLRQDWGYNFVKPLSGGLPGEFDEESHITIKLDKEKNEGELPWGTRLPLNPFFGVMGCAPPKNWGMITSIIPRAHGGNMDNKELVSGTSVFLPIFVEGANFSAGDGHGCQGDGEVCVTAIETALEGKFRLTVRDDLSLTLPQAESPSHFITMGFDEDLDDAAKEALRQMIILITQRTNLSKSQAYSLCSLAADLRVTQIVNGNKGVHVMLPKTVL